MIGTIFDTSWAWMIGGVILAGLEILSNHALAGRGLLRLCDHSRLARCGTGEASFLNREMEAMIGQEYIAITPFVAGRGRIKVRDSSYAALSDDEIAEGDLVTVIGLSDDRPRVVKAPRS